MEQLPKIKSPEKAKYFSSFALRHIAEMRLLKEGGVLGKENEDWRNVSEHCITEAVAGSLLAEGLGIESSTIEQALLLHDWYKRQEVEGRRKGISIQESMKEDKRLLEEKGISENIIALTQAIVPQSADEEYVSKRTIGEKIVHFLDLSTSGSEFVDFHDRIAEAEKSESYRQLSETSREKYEGKSLSEWDVTLAEQEQQEFEQKLNIEKGTLLEWLKAKIEDEIKKDKK